MPGAQTKYFGSLQYDSSRAVFHFPKGLPGFEAEKTFLWIENRSTAPVVYLQSLATPELCFLTLPVSSIDPQYQLHITDEDLELLGVEDAGSDQLALVAIVYVPEQGTPTANLLSPIVIHRARRTAVQAVPEQTRYSAQHPLIVAGEKEQPSCS